MLGATIAVGARSTMLDVLFTLIAAWASVFAVAALVLGPLAIFGALKNPNVSALRVRASVASMARSLYART